MKPTIRNGYPQVALSLGRRGMYSHRSVHLLVLLAFVGPRPDGLVSRHRDGNRLDCRLVNLVYGTVAENNEDTVRHGNHHFASRTHCKSKHLLPKLDAPGTRRCAKCAAAATARYKARRRLLLNA